MWWYMSNNSSSQSGNGYKEIQVPDQPRLQLSENNREQENKRAWQKQIIRGLKNVSVQKVEVSLGNKKKSSFIEKIFENNLNLQWQRIYLQPCTGINLQSQHLGGRCVTSRKVELLRPTCSTQFQYSEGYIKRPSWGRKKKCLQAALDF